MKMGEPGTSFCTYRDRQVSPYGVGGSQWVTYLDEVGLEFIDVVSLTNTLSTTYRAREGSVELGKKNG